MNKQELIESLKLTRDSYSDEASFRGGVRAGLGIALGVIDQLDEPTKVEPLVVPKELGEWLAHENLGNEGSLFSIIGGLEDMWVGSHFEDFITNNKGQLIEVILGNREYVVEQEKLYYVLNKHGETLLVLLSGTVRLSVGYTLRDSNKDKYQLTEKQIKDYDERYLSFMVPINEVTE